MTTWNAAPMPELGLELVRDVDRERIRSRLPRWDPRLWGDAQFSKNTRPGNRLLKLGLAWGRERVKARKLQQENITPTGDVAPVSRFTGKEEDVEVGLQYFGKRYLSPYLGRWISADPLAVHAPGKADLNLYAYVSGHVLKATDPLGLEPKVKGPSGYGVSHDGGTVTFLTEPELAVAQVTPAPSGGGGESFRDQQVTQMGHGAHDAAVEMVSGPFRLSSALNEVTAKATGNPLYHWMGQAQNWIADQIDSLQYGAPADGTLRLSYEEHKFGANVFMTLAGGAEGGAKGLVDDLGDGINMLRGVAGSSELKLGLPKLKIGACFAAGTNVLMADGSVKAIEEVDVGDEVLSNDPGDSVGLVARKVIEIHRNASYRFFHIDIGAGKAIVSTGRHPFWTQRGWVAAEDLTTNDVLTDEGDQAVEIRAIAVESRDAATFNLSIDGTHTYFVVTGYHAVLVHNVDPWDILFTHDNVSPVFEHGARAGEALEDVAAEARRLGRLPDGLKLEAVRMADGRWATLNNRTLMIARMANLSDVSPVDAGDAGLNKFNRNLRNAGLAGPVENAYIRCD